MSVGDLTDLATTVNRDNCSQSEQKTCREERSDVFEGLKEMHDIVIASTNGRRDKIQ